MSKIICIGICGKPGAGKDTIGELLSSNYGFQKMTLKSPIESIVQAVLSVDNHNLYDRDAREQPLAEWPDWTVRKALQGVGLAMREVFGADVWAHSLCLRIKEHTRIFIPDVRTPNDVKYVKHYVQSHGGDYHLWLVRRPGFGSTTSGGFTNHQLESYDLTPECDVVFDNDGTVKDLYNKVDESISNLLLKD